MKTRKRLTGIVVAFMLTFIVGSAFAFDPGMLDILGSVNVAPPEEMHVVWSVAEEGERTTVNAEQEIEILNGLTRKNQTIYWSIKFQSDEDVDESVASLIATATNESALPAIITYAYTEWAGATDLDMISYGLTSTIDDTAFVGTIAAGGIAVLEVDIQWDGTIRDDMTPGAEGYVFTGAFTIIYDYELLP